MPGKGYKERFWLSSAVLHSIVQYRSVVPHTKQGDNTVQCSTVLYCNVSWQTPRRTWSPAASSERIAVGAV